MAALTQSPTMAQPLTAEGTIVGTFQYMAPEQLEGREADARSDLWSLGCVLYEMATGRRAFEGKSQASLIGAIMNSEPPPLSQVAPMAPPALDRLVRTCLAKDPEERIQTAHDARLQIQWIAEGGSQAGVQAPVAARRRSRERTAWIVAAALFALAAALGGILLLRPRPESHPMRVAILPPEGANIDDDETHFAISPDGTAVVFVATDSTGLSQLWVRELAAPEARPLPGTSQAYLPFWSPDSRFIAFFAEGKLRKVDVAGKIVQVVCDAPDGRGGTWGRRGTIVFAPASMGVLMQVPEGGGAPTPATTLDSTRRERGHRFPSFLPDGDRFLYVTLSGRDSLATRMGSVSKRESRWVVSADGAAIYAAPAHLLFARSGALMVQGFDDRRARLTGEPHVLGPASGLTRYAGGPAGSVSANGVVAQRHRAQLVTGLAWLDRGGRRTEAVPVAASQFLDLSLAPDDDHAALTHALQQGGTDIWTIELSRGVATRLTFDSRLAEKPVWSPDGQWVAFSSLDSLRRNIHRKRANGAGETELYLNGQTGFTDPAGWSRDGRYFLYRDLDPVTGEDVWGVREDGDRIPFPVLHSRYHEEDPKLSPDGRWLAYRSDESGRTELYVQSFPTLEAKYRVSTDGAGTGPRSDLGKAYWRKDGRELIYVGGDGVTVLSVPVETAGGFKMGVPRPLFRIPASCSLMVPTSDLQRFLVLEQRSTKEGASIQLILDWPSELKSH
jgi:Tol biopolymer transport system component